MPFQFQCPHDHLLEGEESQAGQAIHCPVCNVLFLIPDPVGTTTAATSAAAPAEAEAEKEMEPELLHIACPNGHVLEVPPEMLETEVLCPQCNAQFHLRARDSVEHREKRQRQEVLRDEKMNKFWFNFSIGAAVLVVLMLLVMIVISAMNRESPEPTPAKAKAKPAPAQPAADSKPARS